MSVKLLYGVDVREGLKTLEPESVHCVVTSPPYWGLRDYGENGQLGLEKTPEEYVKSMVAVFQEVKRVLRADGTLWLNLGDSYAGSGKGPAGNLGAKHNERHLEHKTGGIVPDGLKPKDLVGIPWMVAFALRADGWYLRQDIIWAKPNPMPESVTDRCTKSHEYVFLLTKSAKYYYDAEAIKENAKPESQSRYESPFNVGKKEAAGSGRINSATNTAGFKEFTGKRNKRSVWTVATKPYKGAHFATFPPELITPMILAGCPAGGTVLDPFSGSGTTGAVAVGLGRSYIGIDLNKKYEALATERIGGLLVDNPTRKDGE